MTPERQSLIDDLRTAVDLVAGCAEEQGAHRRRVVLRKGVAVNRERRELEAWLHRAWEWCDRNPDDPRLPDREDRLIAGIREYEALCDALRAAEARL